MFSMNINVRDCRECNIDNYLMFHFHISEVLRHRLLWAMLMKETEVL
jgi:hypothetical protein